MKAARAALAGGRGAVTGLLVLAGCTPGFDGAPSLLEGPRLLAVLAEPPESAPGDEVALRAVVAGPAGAVATSEAAWSLCRAPKGPAEDNVVARACLERDALVPVGVGSDVRATIPGDACARFGPDAPPVAAGQPPLRPRDPDDTGGYYQPVRVDLAPLPPGFALVRIRCGLAGAAPDVAARFRAGYQPNRNPRLRSLVPLVDGAEVPRDHLPPGRTVTWRLRADDDARERFLLFDRVGADLVVRSELLQLSWFATAGRFAADHTLIDEPAAAPTSELAWTAPESAAEVHFAVVARDSRGGSDALLVDGRVAP